MTRSSWGERDATRWIDAVTGLPVGAAAEAYLAAASQGDEGAISVFALAVDRLEALAIVHGAKPRTDTLAQVAHTVSKVGAPIGVIPASYPDATIVLIAPGLRAAAAKALGLALRTAMQPLAGSNAGITVSVGIVTALRGRSELMADARRLLKDAIAAGGNRVVAVDLSSH